MRKVFLLKVFLLFFIVSCSNDVKDAVLKKGELPLPEFLIGSWEGNQQISDSEETYWEEYHLMFRENNTLRFSMTSPSNDFDSEFTYDFVDDNTMLVENNRSKGDMWRITKMGDDKLLICRGSTVVRCIEYLRVH